MSNDNVFKLIQPGTFDDQLTEILRQGARSLMAQAVEAEVADFLAKHTDLKTEDGRQRVVRHGHLPEREVMTGIGPVAVRQPRVRDREAAANEADGEDAVRQTQPHGQDSPAGSSRERTETGRSRMPMPCRLLPRKS